MIPVLYFKEKKKQLRCYRKIFDLCVSSFEQPLKLKVGFCPMEKDHHLFHLQDNNGDK